MKSSTKAFVLVSVFTVMMGCSSDTVDEAVDAINKLGLTTVYAANGTTQEIITHLDGTDVDVPDNETIQSYGDIRLLSQFDTPDIYNLSYTINGTTKGEASVAKNSHTLYAATECGTGIEHIQHELNGDDNVYVMNLTDTVLVTGIIDISRNGTAVTLSIDPQPCTTTALNVSSTDGTWSVVINGMELIKDELNFAGSNSLVVLAVYNVTATSEAAVLTFIAK